MVDEPSPVSVGQETLSPSRRIAPLAHRIEAEGAGVKTWRGKCGNGTLPLRDPLNEERRFIPLRLDDAPIKGSLAQFLYINWRSKQAGQATSKAESAMDTSIPVSFNPTKPC
jgi:hypothetical protein